jgi:hypothetical protein
MAATTRLVTGEHTPSLCCSTRFRPKRTLPEQLPPVRASRSGFRVSQGLIDAYSDEKTSHRFRTIRVNRSHAPTRYDVRYGHP